MSDVDETQVASPPGLSAGDVFRAALATDAARLIAHEPLARRGVDTEGVHQSRVATRRLRSHLVTFAPILREGPTVRLSTELRRLGRTLGTVRDLDVLHERFELGVSTFEPIVRDDGVALLSRLTTERAAATGVLSRQLATKRHEALLGALGSFVAAPPFRTCAGLPAELFLAEAVQVRLTKLERDIAALAPVPTDPTLHELRIVARPARYTAEVATGALGPTCGQLAKRLAALCDDLGILSDGANAGVWLDRAGDVEALAFAVALLRAREIERMRAPRDDWRRCWERVQITAGAAPWRSPPG